jgi:hypothetical protein
VRADVEASRVTPASDAAEASVPSRSIFGTLRAVGTLVAPTTLVVALLYYFGWARTSTQAFVMGLDESLFGFTAQDYILRSITAMFWPLFVAAGAILVGLVVHGRLVNRTNARFIRRTRICVALTGGILLLLGLIGSTVDQPSRLVSLGAPLAVTVGIGLIGYAAYLGPLPVLQGGREGTGTDASGMALAWSLLTLMFLLSAFWTVSHYAAIKGIDFAREVVRQLPRRPSVILYSSSRLYLEEPVVEVALPGEEGAYRYKYTGLKLLFRADENLFLRPSDLSVKRNIVIPEEIGIRVEYE